MGGQEHARVARVDWKRQHAPSQWGDRAGGVVDGAQVGEQRLRAFQRARIGRFEPAECFHVIDAARLEREDHLGKIEPFHFGKFLGSALVLLMRGPEAQAMARRGAAGATGALVGRGAADFFDEQCVDAAVGIVARNTRQAAVDHQAHAVDGERGLRDVGGDDDLAPVVLRHRGVLITRR